MAVKSTYAFSDFELDLSLFELRRDGQRIAMQPKALGVLEYLIRHRNRAVTREELIENVWEASAKSDSTVPTCITAIRRALDDDYNRPRIVATVRGRGYRFVGTLTLPADRSPDAASQQTLRTRFVGRRDELVSLRAFWEEAKRSKPSLVLVSGDAGIGKSRLLEEFINTLGADPIVVTARCREEPGAPALWPWVQIIRACLAKYGEEPFAEVLPRLAPLLHILQDSDPPGDTGTVAYPAQARTERARFLLFDGVASFLRVASAHGPLLLVLDDLHRSDAASIRLLGFVSQELPDARLLFLVAARGAVDGQSPLTPLANVPSLAAITLLGLSRSSALELASGLSSTKLSEETLHGIYETSEGNPFFLTQLVRLRGTAPTAEPAGQQEFDLGADLRLAVLHQLRGFPDEARTILSTAAVIGRDFSVPLVASVTGISSMLALDRLRPAVSAGIIGSNESQAEELRFAHVLVRDALYEALTSAERSQIHRCVADSLEALRAPAATHDFGALSHHYTQAASTGCAKKAWRYSELAAEAANDQLAFEEAVERYRAACRMANLGDAPASLQCRLLIALGQAELRAELRTQGRDTLQRAATLARKLNESSLIVDVALSLAPGPLAIEVGVYDPLLVSLLEEALTRLGSEASELRCRVLARLSIALVWANQEGRRAALSSEALVQSRVLGDQEARSLALVARHGVLGGPENLADRIEIANEIGTLASPAQNPESGFMHRTLRITDLLEQGDIAGVDQEIRLYTLEAEESRQPHFLWYALLFRSMRALMSARYGEAKSLADRFLATGQRINDENSAHSYGAHQVIRLWDAGRVEETIAIIQAFADRFAGVAGWRCALPVLLFEAGLKHEAEVQFEQIARSGFDRIPRNETWFIAVGPLALACARLENQQRAEELLALLEPGMGQFGVLGFGVAHLGSIAAPTGVLHATLGHWRRANELLDFALEQDERIGAMQWVVRNRYESALALSVSPVAHLQRKAAHHAQTALELASKLGMSNITARARRLL